MYKQFLLKLVKAREISDFDFQCAYKDMICSESGVKDCQDCILAKNCSVFF